MLVGTRLRLVGRPRITGSTAFLVNFSKVKPYYQLLTWYWVTHSRLPKALLRFVRPGSHLLLHTKAREWQPQNRHQCDVRQRD